MGLDRKRPRSLSPQSIARLAGAHREFLAFLERRVESRAVAEDILQTAFARGLERGAGVEDENIVAWFYRVLRNAIVDHYRRRSTAARAMEAFGREFSKNSPGSELRGEIYRCVSALLETLKPEYRDALRTVDLEEGALSDLAHRAGITADNAAVRVHRARKALRRQVERSCGVCAQHGCLDCQCAKAGRSGTGSILRTGKR